VQKTRIPQGSILSTLLTSIYYEVMKKDEFKFIKDDVDGVDMLFTKILH
jgi:hypothetical protein